MAICTVTEIMDAFKAYTGDRTDDESLALTENLTDTLNDFEEKTKDTTAWQKKFDDNNTQWQQKYNENENAWRKRYKDRFYGKEVEEPDLEPTTTIEQKPITKFEDLFSYEK